MATQSEFAEHVGITKQAASELKRQGVIHEGGTLDEWRLAYCAHIRGVASGRNGGAQGLKLTDERARLAKLQADKVEIELAELRGELAMGGHH
jgi:terminase small subunit / prophage DNA-packing protein